MSTLTHNALYVVAIILIEKKNNKKDAIINSMTEFIILSIYYEKYLYCLCDNISKYYSIFLSTIHKEYIRIKLQKNEFVWQYWTIDYMKT